MNQRMVWAPRDGSVSFWAWTTSITVHLIVLTAFGIVKFSQSGTQAQVGRIPTAKISQIKKLTQASPVIPKPKIREPTRGPFVQSINPATHGLSVNKIFGAAKPGTQDLIELAPAQSVSSLPSGVNFPHRIEFFGSFTDQRKVCYLVDCSGSMRGLFGRVRAKLKESIASLQPDQYFYIIFFGSDKLFESGNGRLLRATPKAKSTAYHFIDSVQPAGRTNALPAFERAVRIRDGRKSSASVIYFLTDGFELTKDDAQRFPQKIAKLQKRFAPKTKINTIGFWAQSDDRRILEAVARQSGGEFVWIDN